LERAREFHGYGYGLQHIYRSAATSTAYQKLDSSLDTQTSYVDMTVQSGLSYTYIVKSVDLAGIESAPSNPLSVTIP
jgi:fibronectin type 3 domain-containing protein